ncbi:MAG: SOS response-associated peptidase [Prolixibacteraceae bacterium]|jgi:putative SOS response-associated peptidase YedK|nr:SOS response-associated peptidase [Prolixibacteraceae bacterium]
MCGRFVLIDKIETIEKTFNAKLAVHDLFSPNYNVSIGQKSLVVTNEDPKQLQYFQFGFTPSWAKKQMYLFNARAEGDHNKENDPGYHGAKGIIEKPAFRSSIRAKRCLIIASAFIEGTTNEGLDKPFLVHLNKRPFAFAGLWDSWTNPDNQEVIQSFSIITTTANELLQKIPHHRMPVILPDHAYHTWLNQNSSLSQITELLVQYPAERMNAYPISPDIKDPKNNKKELLSQLGEKLNPEIEIRSFKTLQEKGFGRRKRF